MGYFSVAFFALSFAALRSRTPSSPSGVSDPPGPDLVAAPGLVEGWVFAGVLEAAWGGGLGVGVPPHPASARLIPQTKAQLTGFPGNSYR